MLKLFDRPDNKKEDQFYAIHDFLAGEKRTLFLYGPMLPFSSRNDQFSPWAVMDTMIALDSVSDEPILLVVDSPGGCLSEMFSLHDTIKMLNSPVYILGRSCASAAVLILCAGAKGHRYLLPNSRVMLHLPSGVVEGDVVEIKIQQKEFEKIKESLINLLIENGVKKTKKQILKDIDREYWMSAEEAVKYGLADKVISNWKQIIDE